MKKLFFVILFCFSALATFAQNQSKTTTKSLQSANPVVVIDNKVLGDMNDPEVKKIMDNLDKNNIDNLTILKDSTICIKLYGIQAKYGAIVITTKKK